MIFLDSNIVLVQATFSGLLLALSIQVPLRMGVFSFSGAGCYGLGAYATGILVLRYDTSPFLALLLAVVMCVVLSTALGLLVSGLTGLYLAMATVAFDLTISVIAINGGEVTGASTGLFGVITDFGTQHLVIITLAALALVTLSEVGRTRRRVEVVREDPELAASVGVNVRRYRLYAFAASGALGALGGGTNILVRSYVGPLDIGFPLIVLALTMIIVGGSRSWRGAVIGAIAFTWLPELLSIIGQWQELVYGVIVAISAIYLPTGIYGLYLKGYRRWKRSHRDHQLAAKAGEVSDEEELHLAVAGGSGPAMQREELS